MAEIQPLMWNILDGIPEELATVYALKLPDHWREEIRSLGGSDRSAPIRGIHAALWSTAPELKIFHSAFARTPANRPEYWLASDSASVVPNSDQFLQIVRAWLNINYEAQGETVGSSFTAEE